MDVSDGSREGVELSQLRGPLSVPGGLRERWLSGEAGSSENNKSADTGDRCEAAGSVGLA